LTLLDTTESINNRSFGSEEDRLDETRLFRKNLVYSFENKPTSKLYKPNETLLHFSNLINVYFANKDHSSDYVSTFIVNENPINTADIYSSTSKMFKLVLKHLQGRTKYLYSFNVVEKKLEGFENPVYQFQYKYYNSTYQYDDPNCQQYSSNGCTPIGNGFNNLNMGFDLNNSIPVLNDNTILINVM